MKITTFPVIVFLLVIQQLRAEVYLQKIPQSVNESKSFSVKVDNKPLSLFAVPSRYGNNISFAAFSFTDSVALEIKTNFPSSEFTKWSFLPVSDSIRFKTLSNGTTTLNLYKPTKLTVILNGDYRGRTLHIVAARPHINPPDPDGPGILYFGPGLHEIPAEQNYTINIESNRKVFIAPGAVVRGYINSENAENVKIFGQGVLMSPTDSAHTNIIDIEACSNISISGISILTSKERNGIFIYKSDQSNVKNVNIINPVIWKSNGIVIANSSNTSVNDCFIRSGGDAISMKGLGNNRESSNDSIEPGSALPTTLINISKCRIWSDNNNAISIGPETMAEYVSDIDISDCELLFVRDEEKDKAALAIVALQSTEIYNVHINHVRIYTSGQLALLKNSEKIASLTGSQQWPGEIHDIRFSNIQTFERGNDHIQIHGWDSTKMIYNIAFENIITEGDTLTTNSSLLNLNDFTSVISVDGDTIKKPVQKEPVTSTPQ